MNDFWKKNLGIILVLVGVVCLLVYFFAVQSNVLLVISLLLEVAGIGTFIYLNKRED